MGSTYKTGTDGEMSPRIWAICHREQTRLKKKASMDTATRTGTHKVNCARLLRQGVAGVADGKGGGHPLSPL